jgi:hypothetical protein
LQTLREIQTDFAAALLDDAIERALPLISSRHGDRLAGVEIYRNNVREAFAKTLALEFPVIEKLVGPDYFHQLSRQYQRQHPSSSGDLQFVGAAFAEFLDRKFTNSNYDYLADVARLEWLCECVAIAAEDDFALLNELAGIDPELYPQLLLPLRSDRALIASPYPILTIWRQNQALGNDEQIDLAQGDDCLLVLRGDAGIEINALTHSEYHFVKLLSAGTTLTAALDAAMAIEHSFDVGLALRRFFQLKVFRQVLVPDTRRTPAEYSL